MAIKMAYTSSMLTYHDQAYARIELMAVHKVPGESQTQLAIYASQEAAVSGSKPLEYKSLEGQTFDYSGENFVSQSYDQVKLHPMFTASIDV